MDQGLVDADDIDIPCKHYSLPYIGVFSSITQKRLQRLVTRYCSNLRIRLAFTSFKIGRLFSTKDLLPLYTRSHVVYKFSCASCGACYVGETCRHLHKRIHEHVTMKSSNIYRHLHNNTRCLDSFAMSDFTIFDSANSEFSLQLKEALHIHWLKSSLNAQVHHADLTLF